MTDEEEIYELTTLIEREDKTLAILSADSTQTLYTTRAQLELETRVAEKLDALAKEIDPRFDEQALSKAIRDFEWDKTQELRASGSNQIFQTFRTTAGSGRIGEVSLRVVSG